MNKIRVIELFAGYGSQHLALKRLRRDHPDFQYEVVAFCEIDKHAIKAYRALHGTHIPNLGDITQVNPDDVPDCDLMTWSFPCTDISTAGQMKGLSENSQTRSSLCWEAVRLFRAKRPKYLVMENVKNLVSEKFQTDFNALQLALQKIGYTNFWQVMNAKDYGVPQNRERVFMVSVLDCRQAFYFPQPFPLTRRLKDVLEQNVDERYYLSDERVAKLIQETAIHRDRGNNFAFRPCTPEEIAFTVKCSGIGDKTDNYIAEPQIYILGTEGIAPAVINGEKDGMPKIVEPQMLGWTRNEKGEITDRHPVSVANCVTAAKRDNTQNYIMEPTIISPGHGYFEGAVNAETSPTVKCSAMQAQHFVSNGIRFRRLTERELYRLMDVDEKDIDILLAAPIPRTQHAKLAGNSICVACLYHIFEKMFVSTVPAAGTQTMLF